MVRRFGLGALAILALLRPTPADAAAFTLTPAQETQIKVWLGMPTVTLTSIFSKEAGDGKSVANFHTAVDNQGPTVTVVMGTQTTLATPTQLFGGYNPQSWDSHSHYHSSPTDAERTAFLFNLDTNVKQEQKLTGDVGPPTDPGQYQTYNNTQYAASFGWNDLYTGWTFGNNFLEFGIAKQVSYGASGVFHQPIYGPATTGTVEFNIAGIEVYKLTEGLEETAVPEPASMLLLGTGLAGIARAVRRRRAAQTVV